MDTSHEQLIGISWGLWFTLHAVGLIREAHVDLGMHAGAKHISFDLDADWARDVEGQTLAIPRCTMEQNYRRNTP